MVCNPQREVIFCIGPDYRPRFFWKFWFSFHYPVVVFLVPDDTLPVVPVCIVQHVHFGEIPFGMDSGKVVEYLGQGVGHATFVGCSDDACP